jgi:hypothetical protein
MIGVLHRSAQSFAAASDMVPNRPVTLDTNAARQVVLAASNNLEPHGFIGPATAPRGEQVTVFEQTSVVEAIAAASLGPGADVGVASTNGAIGPVAGASGITRYRVGKSEQAAAAGDKFALYVSPKQVSNLI